MTARRPLILFGVLVSALGVALSTAAPSAPSGATALPPRETRKGAEIFGINEAVSIPRRMLDEGTVRPEEEPTLLAEDAAAAVGVGARIVRGPTQVYPHLDMQSLERRGGDWTRADQWVRAVQAAGLEALLMVSPWPGNQTAGHTERYPPDPAAFAAYVTRVVERYDGDGVDDMPGLARGIHFWEVDNEPDLHNSRPPRDMQAAVAPELFETPAEYAAVLKTAAQAIRAADPQARVLMAGLYNVRNAAGAAYAEALARQPGFLDSFDIANVHCYFEQDDLDAVAATLAAVGRMAPGKPIWVTETSVPARGSPPYQTAAWQGKMVAAIYGAFLAGGVDRVFWHTLADPPLPPRARGQMPFATNSLLALPTPPMGAVRAVAPAEDKPAGAVYRRLAGLLADTDPALYREEKASGGRLLWTGAGWLAFWGEPRTPAGAGEVVNLLDGSVGAAGERVTAPAFVRKAP